MKPEYSAYISRLKAQLDTTQDISQVPQWIRTHTRDPRDRRKLFGFKGHEYQIEMISDPAEKSAIRKCSQVGATEIWFRAALAMLNIYVMNLIYILPTGGFVRKVSKGRVDPMIDASPTLRSLLDHKTDNVEMKRFRDSFLYLSGSFGKSSGISVPAQAIFKDEVDFCNQANLTTFASRTGHSKEGEFFDRSFSTPTVFDYGIDLLFKEGSQAFYNVKCPTCKEYTELDYMSRVEIPGFEGTLKEFEKEDLFNPTYWVDQAFMRCGHCNAPLPHSAFVDPANRKWIHRFPEKALTCSSRQIYPLDVPEVNPLPRTIRQMKDYKRKKDWANFKIGEPYQDAETSFLEQNIRSQAFRYAVNKPGPEPVQTFNNAYFGLDVGKTCHLVVAVPGAEKGNLDVVYMERIRQDGENRVLKRMKELSKTFKFRCGVIDAAPDITLAESVTHWRPGVFWACRYLENTGKSLDIVRLVEEERVAMAVRNSAFDELAKATNTGKIRINQANSEFELMVAHLKTLKKVALLNEESNEFSDEEHWVSTGEDHYGHALNYVWVAAEISGMPKLDAILPFMPTVAVAQMKDYPDPSTQKEFEPFASVWARMGRKI